MKTKNPKPKQSKKTKSEFVRVQYPGRPNKFSPFSDVAAAVYAERHAVFNDSENQGFLDTIGAVVGVNDAPDCLASALEIDVWQKATGQVWGGGLQPCIDAWLALGKKFGLV